MTYPKQDILPGAKEGAQPAFKHMAAQRRVNKIRGKEGRSVLQAIRIICHTKEHLVFFMAQFPCITRLKTRLEVITKIPLTAKIPQIKDDNDSIIPT